MLAYLQDDECAFVYRFFLLVSFHIYWRVKRESRFWAAHSDMLAYLQDDVHVCVCVCVCVCDSIYSSLLLVSFHIYWPVKISFRIYWSTGKNSILCAVYLDM